MKPTTAIATRDPSPQLVEQANGLADWLKVKTISTAPERETAVATLRAVKSLLDQANAEKEEVYRPIKTALDTWSKKCAAIIKPLESVEKHLKGLVGHFDAAEQLKAQAALEKEAKKAERKGQEQLAGDLRAAEAQVVLGRNNDGVSYRTVRYVTVTDPKLFFAYLAKRADEYPGMVERMCDAATVVLNGLMKAGAVLPAGTKVHTEHVSSVRI